VWHTYASSDSRGPAGQSITRLSTFAGRFLQCPDIYSEIVEVGPN